MMTEAEPAARWVRRSQVYAASLRAVGPVNARRLCRSAPCERAVNRWSIELSRPATSVVPVIVVRSMDRPAAGTRVCP
jgi:hypothetical protein